MSCNLPGVLEKPAALQRALPLALVSQVAPFHPCLLPGLRAGAMSGGLTQAGGGLGHKYGVPQRARCSWDLAALSASRQLS